MNHLQALDELATHPHSAHFRRLCADDSDPERRDAWRARVIGMARGEAPRPSAAAALGLVARSKACPYRSTDAGCGCSGARCGLRGGATVSHVDCFACIARYGP
jgi:hypothetical protein